MDFGEVVTTSSRAFWNDYEDFETNRPVENISIDYGTHTLDDVNALLSTVDTLLVIEGAAIHEFVVEAILQTNARLLCKAGAKCSLFRLADTKTAVLHAEASDLMSFGLLAEQLVAIVGHITRVVTLNVEPSVAYKSDRDSAIDVDDARAACFVRGLSSDGALPNGVPALDEPNFLTGVAAGIVSWRKFADKSWASYVAYVNEPAMNSLTTSPMLRLLRYLGIGCAATYTVKSANESNLYT